MLSIPFALKAVAAACFLYAVVKEVRLDRTRWVAGGLLSYVLAELVTIVL